MERKKELHNHQQQRQEFSQLSQRLLKGSSSFAILKSSERLKVKRQNFGISKEAAAVASSTL